MCMMSVAVWRRMRVVRDGVDLMFFWLFLCSCLGAQFSHFQALSACCW